MRNASGLTAADIARTQGFQDCTRLLLGLQSCPLSGFCSGGMQRTSPGPVGVGANRKRCSDDAGPFGVKKARATAPSPAGTLPPTPGAADDDADGVDGMHVDRELTSLTGGRRPLPAGPAGGALVDDGARQEGGAARPAEVEVCTVSAMQTPCRCRNQYACYF
ncbi:Ankyrin repeat domain-containing protein 10 [Galemys pyrenaicus]|uniref:Ankyrin repeat domain-containing protein 10 n=1 Tax=Galemys pyrenaicus TaxID=202257 RepID=A0A8J6ADL4_GALPY|nr:Ankyrin repeat domain-containing protein 10 [Galemys pyrenaicus]